MTATFPLIPRRRVLGLPFGGLHSIRRGLGSDVASSRPYQPGDDVGRIDWNASARLSLARGTEEFVVREHYAEEAPRVVVLGDRRPSMSVFPEGWPWLCKPRALREAAALIGASASAARGLLGALDEAEGVTRWRPPRSEHELVELDGSPHFTAPEDTVERGLGFLYEQRRDLPAGSFVFVLSDFLAAGYEKPLKILRRRHDVVAIPISDPLETALPDRGLVRLRDAETGLTRVFDAGDPAFRAAWQKRGQPFPEPAEVFRSSGVDSIPLTTDAPYERALVRFFKERERRRSAGR